MRQWRLPVRPYVAELHPGADGGADPFAVGRADRGADRRAALSAIGHTALGADDGRKLFDMRHVRQHGRWVLRGCSVDTDRYHGVER